MAAVHEFSIAQALVEAAVEEARRAGAMRVNKLNCRIGTLRQVNDWLMQEAFGIARADTLCAEAVLVIKKTYLRATCPQCRVAFAVRDWDWTCPTCGSLGADPAGGDELELLSLEAEVPDESRSS
jgi:hydrogenase nickel incorporation protein HypA/HybF